MNRYAPPASELVRSVHAYQLGKAGWLAAAATPVHLLSIDIGYPRIVEFFAVSPVAVFFVLQQAALAGGRRSVKREV